MKILTFDIEDWFHILDHPTTKDVAGWSNFPSRIDMGVDRILSMLDDHNTKATFFCLGWVGEKFPHIVKRIANSGHQIGSHSFAHQLVYQQSANEFKSDLKKSVDTLQQIIGQKVNSYRAPGFSITRESAWALECLIEQGIETDCSVFAANRGHGGVPQLENATQPFILNSNMGVLKCFPMNAIQIFGRKFVFSGGGYFRILPFSANYLAFSSSRYVMTYFHPRDFDPGQPRLRDLSYYRTFKSYVGLKTSERRLRKILGAFRFQTVENAQQEIEWHRVRQIDLHDFE